MYKLEPIGSNPGAQEQYIWPCNVWITRENKTASRWFMKPSAVICPSTPLLFARQANAMSDLGFPSRPPRDCSLLLLHRFEVRAWGGFPPVPLVAKSQKSEGWPKAGWRADVTTLAVRLSKIGFILNLLIAWRNIKVACNHFGPWSTQHNGCKQFPIYKWLIDHIICLRVRRFEAKIYFDKVLPSHQPVHRAFLKRQLLSVVRRMNAR